MANLAGDITPDEEAQIARGCRRLSSLFRPEGNVKLCKRCGETVYHYERVGPVNNVVYHKRCFKCLICGNYLTIKNYWSNQATSEDREVYCVKHVPRIGHSGVDRSSVQIKQALAAQSGFRQNANKGQLNKPNIDHRAVQIKGALNAQKLNKYANEVSHNADIDVDALHIRGPLEAQLLQKKFQKKFDKHHYPPHIMKKKKELIEAQKQLENTLRREEDQMYETFHKERIEQNHKISEDIKKEWEVRLQDLTDKYERDDKKKKVRSPTDKKVMTMQLETAKKDLEQTMTLKREKQKKTMTIRLKAKEQDITSNLVKQQSEIMLELVQQKKEEIKEEVKKELRKEEEELKAESPAVNSVNGHQPTLTDEELPIDEAMEVLGIGTTSELPPPNPPTWRKDEIIPDQDSMLDSIDENVIEVAEKEQSDYTTLVHQLTENAFTDIEKARALYKWITIKDLNVLEFDDTIKEDTPMGLLRGIKFGTETYHVLFMRLCSYAGLPCVEIKGHSKSVGYEPGMKIKPGTFHNTWNAVLIDGEWRLIQCNWGARHLVLNKDKKKKKQKSKDQIRYQSDDHYFLTDPDQFIHEFWPEDPKWQLLENPITLNEFESLPFVRSVFFVHGMRFDGTKMALIEADERGGLDVKIKIPEERENDLIFFYQLRFAEKERAMDSVYRGAALERFVFQTMVDNTVIFSVHVPTKGEYFFEIFANKFEDATRDNDGEASEPFRLKCACKFKIIANDLKGSMHPLPNCASGEWGPKKALRHFNITPILPDLPDNSSDNGENDSLRAGVVNVEDKVELQFHVPKPLHFLAKLRMNNIEDDILDPFVDLKAEKNKLIVSLDMPQIGQFGLDLYARGKDAKDKSTLTHACKYLLNCMKVSTPMELPKSKSTKQSWGPTQQLEEMGLVALTHKDPKIKLNTSNTCVIEFKVPESVEMTYQFIKEPDEDCRDFVSMQRDDKDKKVMKFIMKISRPGNYMLCIYARYKIDEDRSMPNVFNYLVSYKQAEKKSDSSIFSKSFRKLLNGSDSKK